MTTKYRALFAILFALLFAQAAFATDTDGDGILDEYDDCSEDDTNDTGSLGCDRDADGYGNRCDGDFNQNGVVNSNDFSMYFVPDLNIGTDTGRGTDMNCSGVPNSVDYEPFFNDELDSATPGPSGLPCQGRPFCRANIEARVVELIEAGLVTSFVSEPLHFPTWDGNPDDSDTIAGYPYAPGQASFTVQGGSVTVESNDSVGLPYEWSVDTMRANVNGSTSGYYAYVGENTGDLDVTNQGYCFEGYFNYSDGFANEANNETGVRLAANMNTSATTADPGITWEWANNELVGITGQEDTPFGSVGTISTWTEFGGENEGVQRDDCAGDDNWCYFAHCYYHSIDDDDKLTYYAELRGITGAAAGLGQVTFGTLPDANSVAQLGSPATILEVYIASPESWFHSAGEFMRWSNASGVEFTDNEVRHIGPAPEIEGY